MARDDAGTDQRARIDVGLAQELAAVRHHLHELAGLQRRQWCGGGIHLVAEDPEMAGAQSPVLTTFELEDREFGRGGMGQRRTASFGYSRPHST